MCKTDFIKNSDLVNIFIFGTLLDLAKFDLLIEISNKLVMALGVSSYIGLCMNLMVSEIINWWIVCHLRVLRIFIVEHLNDLNPYISLVVFISKVWSDCNWSLVELINKGAAYLNVDNSLLVEKYLYFTTLLYNIISSHQN